MDNQDLDIKENKSDYRIFKLWLTCIFSVFFVILIIFRFSIWKSPPKIHLASPIKVTLPEGSTNVEMASLLAKSLPNFNKDLFLKKTSKMQGYLFPDTYFFSSTSDASEVVGTLHINFNKKISKLKSNIDFSDSKLPDAIIMASIIEKEAKGKIDASTISGILWKRLKIGMPLEVDAAKQTYLEVGLPNMPISNPGLGSIKSAFGGVDSEYLYYLHDKNGIVHFAKTFSEHRANIKKYLK